MVLLEQLLSEHGAFAEISSDSAMVELGIGDFLCFRS